MAEQDNDLASNSCWLGFSPLTYLVLPLMTDAEIAAKLTKAQREAIYTLRKCDGIPSRHIAAHRVRPLIRRGLINRIERPGFSTWYELTSAGRALLKETNDE